MSILLRKYQENDEAEILRLNRESVHVLSPMDSERFSVLREMCALLIVAENSKAVVGFLMGFTTGAKYDSPNYKWFEKNIDGFLYIDRIVVSSESRGLGIGTQLYSEAKDWAISNSLTNLAAEIDIVPPNEGSLIFHRTLGFRELARQRIGATKVVSLQCLEFA